MDFKDFEDSYKEHRISLLPVIAPQLQQLKKYTFVLMNSLTKVNATHKAVASSFFSDL